MCNRITFEQAKLLRLYDPNSANVGDVLINIQFGKDRPDVAVLVGKAGPDGDIAIRLSDGNIYIRKAENLRIPPLAWVENKPVYVGDELYSRFFDGREECPSGMFEVTGRTEYAFLAQKISPNHTTMFTSCSWKKPGIKKEAWINIYKNGRIEAYPTESDAIYNASSGAIKTMKIDWEE